MLQSVFVYPAGAFRSINYAGWTHVLSVFDITARKSVGLIAIAAVCSLGLRRRVLEGPARPRFSSPFWRSNWSPSCL